MMFFLKKWYLEKQSKKWLVKMPEVIKRLWGADEMILTMKDGRIISIKTKPYDHKINLPKRFVILIDNKPVLEAIKEFSYSPDYTIIRFNYGSWVKEVWRAYQTDKYIDKKIEQALFEPMDE